MNAPDPRETFRGEAQDLLEKLEEALLDLGETPDEHDLIDTAFRALHTLKGSGSMFGFERLAAFTHHVETAFDKVRKGEIAPSRDLITVTLAAQDCMRRLIESPDQDAGDEGEILARLQTVVAVAPGAKPAAAALEEVPAEDGTATYRIRFRLGPQALLTGNDPVRLIEELRALGESTVVAIDDEVPSFETLDPTVCRVRWDVILTTSAPRSAIDDVFLFVLDDMELDVVRVEADEQPRRLGEILVERGDAAPETIAEALGRQHPLGRLLVESGKTSENQVLSALAEQNHVRKEAEIAKATAKGQDTIKVTAERLDGLMDRVGELVIAQARLKQLSGQIDDIALKAVAEEIERLVSELRDTTMSIRLVPIGSLFARFRRMVHDLARDLGKEVRLTTEGEETELDKTVIERLADPMVHLIRNAIDHGVEGPEKRAQAGKPAEGHLHLSARHSGAEVLISIRDDGKGLDSARIRARAEENGLIAPGARLSDADLFQYIFAPGFSTAAEVTSVSGRGVGMDVVKRTIESLRGAIDITSTPGRGAEVTLRLPLTLAIIDGLLVRVGRGRYVIPLSAVEECVELSADDDTRSRGRNFLNIRGELVPFLRLREMFNAIDPPDPYQKVVVVSTGERRVGLVVDQVIGDHQTVIKSLSKLHADVNSFSGATILGDGSVALILDVGHLVAAGQTFDQTRRAS